MIKLAVSPFYSMLTPSQPVLAISHITLSAWQGGHLSTSLKPVWTGLPQITVLCDLCCVEETTATLVYNNNDNERISRAPFHVKHAQIALNSNVYCDSFLEIRQV